VVSIDGDAVDVLDALLDARQAQPVVAVVAAMPTPLSLTDTSSRVRPRTTFT
jgi:hypothetical protein